MLGSTASAETDEDGEQGILFVESDVDGVGAEVVYNPILDVYDRLIYSEIDGQAIYEGDIVLFDLPTPDEPRAVATIRSSVPR